MSNSMNKIDKTYIEIFNNNNLVPIKDFFEKNKPFTLTVNCMTYNHKNYIRKCLDGILSQETNFAFEVIVHDDASTDGSTEIIKEYAQRYPHIIKPYLENENQYKKDGYKTIFKIFSKESKGKYIAYCEGDDYWIDPHKLQKQVEILEKNKNVQMVYTGFKCINAQGDIIKRPDREKLVNKSKSGDVFASLLRRNFIMTLTMCCRKEIVSSSVFLEAQIIQDYLIALLCAALGDLIYIPDQTGCYRLSPNGAMQTQSRLVFKRNCWIRGYVFKLFVQKKFRSRSFIKKVLVYASYSVTKLRTSYTLLKWFIKDNYIKL